MRMALSLTGILISFVLHAQSFVPTGFPQGYFRNPLAIPISLSGNFGELRPNHYHMGLDLKTDKRENLPVYAAADGYIARIKIEPGGFGRAIYINHPNGFTTLYAHLNNFNTQLENWLKQYQYQVQSWKVFPDLAPGTFPVKKGDFIAYSGNTGGSQAPHLHFEIRKTESDINVNPLLFGFPLADKTVPRILRLALYDRTRSTYEQSPRLVSVKATSSVANYTTVPSLITVTTSRISLGISAFDSHSGSTSANGIFEAELYLDEEPIIGFQMDSVSYNDTRYLNAHIDYRYRANGGPYLQHLSELPGYLNSIYAKANGDGVIVFTDTLAHAVRIVVKDAYGNTSILNTRIKHKDPVASAQLPTAAEGLPQARPVTSNQQPATHSKLFLPLMLDGYETDDCEFFIGERALYDSVHIRHSKIASSNPQSVSALHAIGASYIPLQEAILIRIRPIRSLTDQEQRHTVMQWYAGSKKNVQKVEWLNGWASAWFRDFGNFQLLIDTQPPQIVPIGFADGSNLKKATRIAFTVKDNLEKFKNVYTELDGKWLRFTNDKGRTFIYRFDEKCPPGDHELKITVEDEAGNHTGKVYKFVR